VITLTGDAVDTSCFQAKIILDRLQGTGDLPRQEAYTFSPFWQGLLDPPDVLTAVAHVVTISLLTATLACSLLMRYRLPTGTPNTCSAWGKP